jgi:hypothetical protein
MANSAAYADILTDQGDPRGEFIQVQLALENRALSTAQSGKLVEREQQLLAAHERIWLGELAPFLLDNQNMPLWWNPEDLNCDFNWRRGWLDSLNIRRLPVPFARAIAHAPESMLLRELGIDYVYTYDDQDFEPGDDVPEWGTAQVQFVSLYPLRRSPYLGNLRCFRLGLLPEQDDYRYFHSFGFGRVAVELIERMPRLERLHLYARGLDLSLLFSMPLSNLRELRIYHMDWRYPLERLAENPSLRNLTHLQFHPHSAPAEDEASLDLAGVREMVRSPHLPNLTHLQLRLCTMGDAGIHEIIHSGLLGRLKVLDLRHGCITDDGARMLAEAPDFLHLERLDINRNQLTSAGVELLQATGVEVLADDQMGEGSPQYLYEGAFD